jgi:RNA polymerase sigma-70 factor (ECF subfamily)
LHSSESAAHDAGSAPAEHALVRAVAARDRKATADFVALHADAVFAFVSRRLAPRADLVDDLVQEIFLAAIQAIPRFEGASPVRSWILGIARHKVQDVYRQRLREFSIEDESEEPSVELPFEAWIDEVRLSERVRSILGALPEGYRMALLWRYWEKTSAAEMARRTGKTEKAIERMLMRARESFRRRWCDDVA